MTSRQKAAIRYAEQRLGFKLTSWQKTVLTEALHGRLLIGGRRGGRAWLSRLPRWGLAAASRPLIHKGRKP